MNKHTLKLALISLLLMLTSGCQSTDNQLKRIPIGDYYLAVKGYTSEQFSQELTWQKQQLAITPHESAIKLAVLHTMSNKPEYNPYTAKSYLNQVAEYQINVDDLAFVTSLREQLNGLIIQLNQNHQSKSRIKDLTQALDKQTQENIRLNDKIEQLKRIEQTIQQQSL